MKTTLLAVFLLSFLKLVFPQPIGNLKDVPGGSADYGEQMIHNGVPWFDDRGKIVNAHGACIVEEGDRYYLFGEYKTDSVNRFIGFSCYSSPDLVNWKFERIVLPEQRSGLLGPNRIGERVKVMKCPSTGEYIMYMHTDDRKYMDPRIGYATSKTINGEYEFKGALLYEGEPIKKWDMGTFQDSDGRGYLLIHHGDIYQLSDDYRFAEKKVASSISGVGESPAMFKKDGLYYLLSSNLTSWERNDNQYHTAPSVSGPWQERGLFCPEGSLTFNSQCSFVFPLIREGDTIPMYMGDRWSFPNQADAATQVWLPLQTDGTKLAIPEYWPSWNPMNVRSATFSSESMVTLASNTTLSSNKKGDFVRIPYNGSPVGLIGVSGPHGGYARVSITNNGGKMAHSSLVDFYSKVPDTGLRFITPPLPKGDYILHIEVSGEQGVWFNKAGDRYGSDDYWVRVHQLVVLANKDDREYIAPADNRSNPLLYGYFADPEILYAVQDGKYYLYPTSDGYHEWSGTSFKVFSSTDLRMWKDEGVILDLPKDAAWGPANAWAPAIIERRTPEGYRYFFYFSAAKNIGVAVSDSPTGPFRDSGKALIPRDAEAGQEIDPDVFHDPVSGKYYLYWGNYYLRVAELNGDMISLKQGTTKVLTPETTYNEGTYVVYRKGTYYFFWSENDTRSPDYRVRYGISESPTGPIRIPESNLILSKDTTNGIYGTGHNSVIQVPGTDDWYIVYHRFRRPNSMEMGWPAGYHREVCIDKLEFNIDGTIKRVVPTL